MGKRSHQLVFRALLLEGVLLGIAIIWIVWQKIPLAAALTFTDGIAGISAGLILLGINYVLIEYGSRYIEFFRTIKQLIEHDISPLFRQVDFASVLVIAIISGVAEELFFRGVLQTQYGIWVASLIFGLAHIWRKTAILYGIYAAVMGLLFGGLYLWSGSLWVPTLAHIVNNFVAILYYVHYMLNIKRERLEKGGVGVVE